MIKKICINRNLDGSSLFSAEVVVNNEDLIREIFLRLPIRSLIRFKLVSKHWFSLISDPQFACVQTHLLNPNSVVPSGLFFYNSLTRSLKIESVSLDYPSIQLSRVRVPSLLFPNTMVVGSSVTILQSCNGLLLCQFTSRFRNNEYCVYNPTTKNYKILPQLCINLREKAMGFTLAFDPSISPYYKVVSFAGREINIYLSETGKWSTFTCSSYQLYLASPEIYMRSGFYWNGSIYWIKQGYVSYHCFEYDFKEDSFKEVNMPANVQNIYDPTLRYFGESKDRLHLVFVRSHYAKTFKVLERERETLNWLVKYRVHIRHLLSKFPEICVKRNKTNEKYVFSILSVYKGEKEEDSALVLSIQGKVVSYNLHYKTSKVLCELPSQVIDTSGYRYCTSFNFIDSLASV